MKAIFSLAVFVFAASSVRAEESVSPFEREMHRLSSNDSVETRESRVTIGGTEYRRIVVGNQEFYVQAQGRTDNLSEIHCGGTGLRRVGENLAEASVQVTRRTQAFVSVLRESCTTQNGVIRSFLALSPEVGLKFKDEPGDAIKEKKIFVAPGVTNAVGFSGVW